MSDHTNNTDSPQDSADSSTVKSDYDSPWKEAIGAYFQPFMQFFFADVYALIDWNQACEFLDAELQKRRKRICPMS